MSTISLATAHRPAMRTSKLRSFIRMIADALDAFVGSRASQAVPEREVLRCQHEIRQYHRLMHSVDAIAGSRAKPRR